MDVEGELRAVEEGTTEVTITSMCLVFRSYFVVTCTCTNSTFVLYHIPPLHVHVYTGIIVLVTVCSMVRCIIPIHNENN